MWELANQTQDIVNDTGLQSSFEQELQEIAAREESMSIPSIHTLSTPRSLPSISPHLQAVDRQNEQGVRTQSTNSSAWLDAISSSSPQTYFSIDVNEEVHRANTDDS